MKGLLLEVQLLEDVTYIKFLKLFLIGFVHSEGAFGLWLGFWRLETQITFAYRKHLGIKYEGEIGNA